MDWGPWTITAVTVAAIAVVGLVVAVLVVRRQRALIRQLTRTPARAESPAQAPPSGPRVAFVVNPTKEGAEGLYAQAAQACARWGLPEPMWLLTTEEDPGVGQARSAVEAGAEVVVAAGGDGTVRAVAQGLAGTGVPLGLVPLGTGNIFARNLELPLTDVRALLRIALIGRNRPVDVGWLDLERPDGSRDENEHLFLAIAGFGFDAQMVADADEELKKRWGWVAYFVAGVAHLGDRRMRVRLRIDDGSTQVLRARTLLIGNCGRLPGGITLLPDAEIDDGWLDLASIDTRAGVAGWFQLLGDVLLQRVGIRNRLPGRIGRIDHDRARSVQARVSTPQEVQVDGEALGPVVALRAWVEPGALLVRTGG